MSMHIRGPRLLVHLAALAALVGGVVTAGRERRRRRDRLRIRLRRPVIEAEHGHHGPEADEERRDARKRKYDGAAADPGKEGTAAFLFVGCLDRFPMGVVLSSWRTVRFSERGWIGR